MNTIVCMKWGTKFPVDYVNVLYAAVKRHMHRPFEFICFTDDPTGLAKGIIARELPSLGLPEHKKSKGGWPKLAMFKRGLFAPDDLVMVLDVDILIMDDLEPFLPGRRRWADCIFCGSGTSGRWTTYPSGCGPSSTGKARFLCSARATNITCWTIF